MKFQLKNTLCGDTAYSLITLPLGPWFQDRITGEILPSADALLSHPSFDVMMSSLAVNSQDPPVIRDEKTYRYVYHLYWKIKDGSCCLDVFRRGEKDLSAADLQMRFGDKAVSDMCNWEHASLCIPADQLFCPETKELIEDSASWDDLNALLHKAASAADLNLEIRLGGSFDLIFNDLRIRHPVSGSDPDDYEENLWALAYYIVSTDAQEYETEDPVFRQKLICFGQAILDALPQYVPAASDIRRA